MLRFVLLLLVALLTANGSDAAGPASEAAGGAGPAPEPIRVLMMTGQNNHNWQATTPVLKKLIESDGRFRLTIDKEPWKLGPEAFKAYDVVFSNWSMWPKLELDPWNTETKTAFLAHISGGGGLVVMHAGSSIHYQWPEFQALVGRTWRKRKTWHGKKHRFKVSAVGKHPITKGVEPFEIFDELWRNMDPTGEHAILMTADTSRDEKNQGPAEPMLMTTKLGKGRGVNVVLGHDTRSLENSSLRKLLLRSLEWAATGAVAPTPAPRERRFAPNAIGS